MEKNLYNKKQGIKVISRAADVLRVLSKNTGGMSLGQIATQVELPRSTVQRIVSALTIEGFVSPSSGYGGIRLGPEILSLARATNIDLQKRLMTIMHNISRESGETVDLAILEKHRMRFVDQIVGSQRLRTVSSIGEAFPLTTTANGKAALAALEPTRAIMLIRREIKSRKASPAVLEMLLSEIEEIRAGALARDENEHTEGISALGIAFTDHQGEVYALSTPVPSTRYERIKVTLSQSILRCVAEGMGVPNRQ